MKINCLIIDNEPLAIDVIRTHIHRISFLNLVNMTNSAFEAIENIDSEKIDLIFTDIQIHELTGIKLLNSLAKKPLIIFTTAYPDYALQSYEMDAVNYLVKPIPFERLLKVVNKSKKRVNYKEEKIVKEQDNNTYIFFVKTEYKTVLINLSEFFYVKSMKDYVTFHLGNEQVKSLLSINSVEKKSPISQFIGIHRSFIIAQLRYLKW
tara:strand:- start:395 stop:1015 length:621 start_codon:yes stop_codon:yes gene_type:complete